MTDIREIALTLLDEYEASDKYINLSLSSHRLDRLDGEGRAQLTALLYTTVERKLSYDYYIGAISGRAPDAIDMHTRNILRLGIAQILEMRSIPDFAAVNETVKLGRNKGERAFINGVLRAVCDKKGDMPLPPEAKNYKRYLSVKHSYPLWIVKLLDAAYGREECERILAAMNGSCYTDLTVNTARISADELVALFAASGVTAERKFDTGATLRINSSVNPERLPGFSDGLFFVQDAACLISALALDPADAELCVDVCACPGGKSFAASILGAREVYSFDIHESKLSLVTDSAARLGLDNITAAVNDARTPRPDLVGRADCVICDVPCSGLGVLGKKPDLRYKDEESAIALPALQLEILTASARYLKPGGRLVYSTCTLNPAENRAVVDAFLAAHPDFALTPFSVAGISAECGDLTLLPSVHATDGFYMAKITKTDVK